MCSCSDYDPPAAYQEHLRRARKEHICYECRRTIPIDAIYEYVSGIWDGEPNSYKTCQRCVLLRQAHIKAEKSLNGDNCGWVFGDVLSTIRECIQDDREYVKHFQVARRELLAEVRK